MTLSLPASSQSPRPVKPPHEGKQRECGVPTEQLERDLEAEEHGGDAKAVKKPSLEKAEREVGVAHEQQRAARQNLLDALRDERDKWLEQQRAYVEDVHDSVAARALQRLSLCMECANFRSFGVTRG
jgi:hypothetical protein